MFVYYVANSYFIKKLFHNLINYKIYHKYLIVLCSVFLISSCARMAGYKSDYSVYRKDEIKNFISNKTIKYGNQFIYFNKTGQYFSINIKNKETYDMGKWFVNNKLITISSNKKLQVSTLCLYSDKYTNNDCKTIIKNGGKIYFDRFDTPNLVEYKGKQKIKDLILKNNYSLPVLEAYQSFFNEDSDIANKILKIKINIAEKERKEKEERAKQVRMMANSQEINSQRSDFSNGTISMCVPTIPYKCCEYYECRARTASGKYENASVILEKDSVGDCYTLKVISTNGFGNGNTCGGINGGWSVIVNGREGYAKDLVSAIAWILRRL